MKFSVPARSIRLRLQVWYAAVLIAVIGGFAGALYYQVRTSRLRDIDAQMQAAATNLTTALVNLPPHDAGHGPPGPPPQDRPRPPRQRGERPDPDRPGAARADRDRSPYLQPPPRGPRPPEMPLADRLNFAFSMGAGGPRQHLYYAVWRADGSIISSNMEPEPKPPPGMFVPRPHERGEFRDGLFGQTGEDHTGFQWVPPDRRELVLVGPRGELVLVGKPAGRELAELRAFAWQLFGSGMLVLVVGLAGGWLISQSITRPIDSISRTASEISASNLSRRIDTAPIDQELVGLATILNDMFQRLERAFERQSRFTSDASHELRTPLAVIHSHAELALSRPRSADEYRETLTACLKAASRLATLVDGLLMLARADAGRLDTHFASLDLRAIVEEVVDQYRPQAETARISLSTALDAPLAVKGDPALLARISSNLLSNALRYTPEGGRVSVTLRADAQAALLIVEDTGCGIPAEDQAQVFERFFRADKARSRAHGGNGLGLAICKSLVEVHMGSIGFTSVPKRGTRFEVRLPLAATSDGN